jgi:probable HAF family extracellular repeat protein
MQDLGTLGGPQSSGNGINSSGLVVGTADIDSAFDTHAFVYSESTGMVDLNSLIDPASHWELIGAGDINDSGLIVGTGLNPLGQEHAFLLTPTSVPEPSPLAAVLVGGVAWLVFGRQKGSELFRYESICPRFGIRL